MNIFEQATRQKIRFETGRGEISVEQLWDVSLQSRNEFDLDTIAKTINRQLKSVGEESFVSSKVNHYKTLLELKLEIVKYIIAVKLSEVEQSKERIARQEEKEKLMEILQNKEDLALHNLSPEELRKRIEQLG